MPAIEQSGLMVTDIEVLRTHYAQTLRTWRERFLSNVEKLPSQFDARFQRMWEFYLASSEMSFRYGGLVVFQIQLAKKDSRVPVTRNYLYPGAERRERRLQLNEQTTDDRYRRDGLRQPTEFGSFE